MDRSFSFYKNTIIPEWDTELELLLNIQSILETYIKAEKTFIKALHEVHKLRLSDSHFKTNKGLLSIQITLINFITSLESQHADIISNIEEDILPNFQDNHSIQESYRLHYTEVMKQRNEVERFIIKQYNEVLTNYNDTIQMLCDTTNKEYEQNAIISYNQCCNELKETKRQLATNNATFTTICDNYCRIRYNNVSLTASSIRKLFVYISSSLANVQFDIQSISNKLNQYSSQHYYEHLKEELAIPSYTTKLISPEPITIFIPSIHESSLSNPSTSFYSEECFDDSISHIPTNKVAIHSADIDDSIPNTPTFLYPLSLSLLNELSKHKQQLDSTMIRSVSSLLLTANESEIHELKQAILFYMTENKYGALHVVQLMLSVMMFTNPVTLKESNKYACWETLKVISPELSMVPQSVLQSLYDVLCVSTV